MKRSISLAGLFASTTGGGSTVRSGCSDHQLYPARRSLVYRNGSIGSAAHFAPDFTQLLSSSRSESASFVRPLGGISPAATRATSRLSVGSPGFSAGPLSPPASARSRRVRSSPPLWSEGLWHSRQFRAIRNATASSGVAGRAFARAGGAERGRALSFSVNVPRQISMPERLAWPPTAVSSIVPSVTSIDQGPSRSQWPPLPLL